jgi:hypothetical protein
MKKMIVALSLCLCVMVGYALAHVQGTFGKIVKEHQEARKKIELYEYSKGGPLRDLAYLMGREEGISIALKILSDGYLVKDEYNPLEESLGPSLTP